MSDFSQNTPYAQQQPCPVPQQPTPVYAPPPYPVIPIDFAAQALAAKDACYQTELSNIKLRQRLAQQEAREKAYSEIFLIGADGTYTLGRNGLQQLLMDDVIEAATLFYPQPPLPSEPLFLITFHRAGQIILSATDFANDQRLIGAIQRGGVQVHLLRSRRTTADLIRQAINKPTQACSLSPYGGWHQTYDHSIDYWMFPSGSTCRAAGELSAPVKLSSPSSAESLIVLQRFWPVFDAIRSPFHRGVLVLLFHEAALHTLLQQLGCGFSSAFCLFSHDERLLTYLRQLFAWFQAEPVSLECPSDVFPQKLLDRKDQPLLVEDCGRLDNVRANRQLLENALASGCVPWRWGKESKSLPLQAPIILLSSRLSALSCAPEVVCLDFSPEDFEYTANAKSLETSDAIRDYCAAFCGYAASHVDALRSALQAGKDLAWELDDGQLPQRFHQSFRTLISIYFFLTDFLRDIAGDDLAEPLPPQDEFFLQLFDLFLKSADGADLDSIAEQFVAIVRRKLEVGDLRAVPRGQCPDDTRNAVFFDDRHLRFACPCFCDLCQATGQTRPTILAALAEAGILAGAKTNATTAQTRITVWNAYGISTLIPVYALRREAFDSLGDPLILDEEVEE